MFAYNSPSFSGFMCHPNLILFCFHTNCFSLKLQVLESNLSHATGNIVHKMASGLNGPSGAPALLHVVQARVDEYVSVKVHTMVGNLVREKTIWSKSALLLHVQVML